MRGLNPSRYITAAAVKGSSFVYLGTSVAGLEPPRTAPLRVLSGDGHSSHFSGLLCNVSGNVPLWVGGTDFHWKREASLLIKQLFCSFL